MRVWVRILRDQCPLLAKEVARWSSPLASRRPATQGKPQRDRFSYAAFSNVYHLSRSLGEPECFADEFNGKAESLQNGCPVGETRGFGEARCRPGKLGAGLAALPDACRR